MNTSSSSAVTTILNKVAASLQMAGWQTSSVRKSRVVCYGVVKSSMSVRVVYPMILDAMKDGIFAVATYPKKVARKNYEHVYEILNARNYSARYGKFVMDSATGELKFRVFRSFADVNFCHDETMSLLTSLPARMLDSITKEISFFVEGTVELGNDSVKRAALPKRGMSGRSAKKH